MAELKRKPSSLATIRNTSCLATVLLWSIARRWRRETFNPAGVRQAKPREQSRHTTRVSPDPGSHMSNSAGAHGTTPKAKRRRHCLLSPGYRQACHLTATMIVNYFAR
jgi:hypothetical protein